MLSFRSLVAAVGVLVLFAATFGATASASPDEQKWETVSLDNNPGFTIDVEAAVGKDFMPKEAERKNGSLMDFFLSTQRHGRMDCHLTRHNYHEGDFASMGPKEVAAILADPRSAILCTAGEPDAVTLLHAPSTSNEGFPASECVARYSSADDKDTPGVAISNLMIAAPSAIYNLACFVHAHSPDEAEGAYWDRWNSDFVHMEKSLHLPAEK